MSRGGAFWAPLALVVFAWASGAQAQTDEIQVYDGDIAAPRVLNLTLHDNYVARGLRSPAFPGAFPADGSFNGVPEFAYGVTDWFEAGAYLPLYSVPKGGRPTLNGAKLRALFVEPNSADRSYFFGLNFEFSLNARHWDPHRYTAEIRPILGWRAGKVELIFNPILDTAYNGVSRMDFAPATRLAYKVDSRWVIAVEHYADLGPLHGFESPGQQAHQLFAVADFKGPIDVEFGAGFGLTRASDRLTFKLILSRDIATLGTGDRH